MTLSVDVAARRGEFEVRAAFLAAYSVETVGNRTHQEYWIPAEDLDAFNASIVGEIEVIAEYRHGQRIEAAADSGTTPG